MNEQLTDGPPQSTEGGRPTTFAEMKLSWGGRPRRRSPSSVGIEKGGDLICRTGRSIVVAALANRNRQLYCFPAMIVEQTAIM